MKRELFIMLAGMILVFASCGPKPNEKGEYIIKAGNGDKEVCIKLNSDGKIDYIREQANGQPEGFFINFHKNGNTKDLGFISSGRKEGTGIVFYPDGSVNSMGTYKNDQQNGIFWLFDKHRNLGEKREYISVTGKSRMNQWIKFDGAMSPVRNESNFIRLTSRKDTLKSGEPYELAISLEASFNKEYMAVIIGPFDENFDLPSGSKCDTIVAHNFTALYKTTEYKTGLNTVRGMVQDIYVDPGKTESKARNIYFTREFLVRK
jgi:hypothetical protein